MDHMVVLGTIIGLLAFVCFMWQSVQKEIRVSNPLTCRQVLACKGYNETGARNQYSDVRSRAIPNERLVPAFNIDNSFTTSEAERRKEFNLEAIKAIKMTEVEWRKVAHVAKELVGQAVSPPKLKTAGSTTFATLDSLVRAVCLKIVLRILFRELEPFEMDEGHISTITESINKLWIQSKGTGTPVESDKHDLEEALAQVTHQTKPSKPSENPMNLILPAYETLWRVVLSGFLQVTFVKGVCPTLRPVLALFLENPTIATRKEESGASAVSVDFIAREALRLYPSVKRVFREFHMSNEKGPQKVAADIETCQRSKELWGPDAERFNPSRWSNLSNAAEDSFMAFGVSPFVCPAKADFGPMLIGILVAAFAHHVSSEDWHVKLGEGITDVTQRKLDKAQRNLDKALRGEVPLASDRSTYEGLRIVKK